MMDGKHQSMPVVREPARDTEVAGEYDVIVCGGGTAGVPAAIAAARNGARTALFERHGFAGGVAAYSIMPCWHGMSGHHTGLLSEFGRRVAAFGQGPDPFTSGGHMEPETVKIVALNMLEEAGVHLHLHTWVVGVLKDGDRVTGIVTESKSGRRAFVCKAMVDTTGDGDAAALAGAQYNKGDGGKMQGMSLRFRIGHIDLERLFAFGEQNPAYFPQSQHDHDFFASRRRLASAGAAFFLPTRLDGILAAHRDEFPDIPEHTYFNTSCMRPGELSVNCTRVYGLDGTRAEDLSRAEVVTRKQAYAIWRCLRKYVPGFDHSCIVDVAAAVGVRETREVIGDYTLTEDDCRRNAEFPNSVMTTRIAFDAHDVDKYILECISGVCDMPYGCFLPLGVDGLLVGGRCASTDHIANATFRKQESVHQSGQVCGTAAAMAAERGIVPRQLPAADLKQRLRSQDFLTSQADRYAVAEKVVDRTRAERAAGVNRVTHNESRARTANKPPAVSPARGSA
ncbi:MAG TPA: FAD-dependent oxidoreductase [Tepidisphaeraceae bacterium]|jgi:glycine/D-amino acid oxidase-like deaminating enzyme|nr:FAD-dependent oxidoreductase [Tepidisphaeraceae bacterium]